jgi:hypothetical protein
MRVVLVVDQSPISFVNSAARAAAIGFLLLSAAMMFAHDPRLSDAWISAYHSDVLLEACGWVVTASAVAIVFRRTQLMGALMATLLGALPILFASREPLLYAPTLAAPLAWLSVWLQGTIHHTNAVTLQSAPHAAREHS